MLSWMITYCIALPLRPILNFLTDLRIEAILEWARVILSSEILAVILSWCLIAEHVYSDNRSLGLLLCGTSGGLGGWGVRHLSGLVLAVWSALMISSAITWWRCGSEWSVYCHLFHYIYIIYIFLFLYTAQLRFYDWVDQAILAFLSWW